MRLRVDKLIAAASGKEFIFEIKEGARIKKIIVEGMNVYLPTADVADVFAAGSRSIPANPTTLTNLDVYEQWGIMIGGVGDGVSMAQPFHTRRVYDLKDDEIEVVGKTGYHCFFNNDSGANDTVSITIIFDNKKS